MLFHLKNKYPELIPYLEKYAVYFEKMEVASKTILLEEGKISQHYFYIEKGCVRTFFNNKGEEKTVQFFFENEGLASIESFVNNIPGLFTIETLEPSIVHKLAKQHALQLIEELGEQPKLRHIMLQASIARQTHYANEFVSLIRDTPEERYLNLLTKKPHIVQRVPQHYIASYLGISTVHLSRIKSKIIRGNNHF